MKFNRTTRELVLRNLLELRLVTRRPCVSSLKADFSGSSESGSHYVLELEGAKFMNGKCDGRRVDDDVAKGVDVPKAAGTLKVRAAWSGTDRKVKVIQKFDLSDSETISFPIQ